MLPFSNLSNSPNLDWIGESVAETVRESLASENLLVLNRESRREAYRHLAIRPYARLTKASIIRLGEVAEADRVVYGTITASPPPGAGNGSKGLLEINASVLDMRQMRQGPAISVSGGLAELATLQERFAYRILGLFLEARAMPSEDQFRSRRRSIRLDAMENYVRGLLAGDTNQKHRYFTQAARLDPDFSQPCFQLGRLRVERRDYRVAADWLDRVKSSDVHFREATFLLGVCRYHLGDYTGAQAAFRSVLQQVPAPEVWNNLGAAQSRLNLPEAMDSFEKAFESDSTDPVYGFNVGYALWRLGEYDDATESLRGVLERAPEDVEAKTLLARCLKRAGPRQAETRVEALERLKHNFDEMAFRREQSRLVNRNQ